MPIELTCPNLLSGERGRLHLLGAGCPDCIAYTVACMTLEQVDFYYRHGLVDQDTWEGYCWAWATSAPRYGAYADWMTPPEVESARDAGERIRLAYALRQSRAGRHE